MCSAQALFVKIAFFHCIAFYGFVKISYRYVSGFISGLALMFIDPFAYFYANAAFTVAL